MEYKGYVNNILNTLIPKDDTLQGIEKENTAEDSKKNQSFRKPNRRPEKGKSGFQRNTNIKTCYK